MTNSDAEALMKDQIFAINSALSISGQRFLLFSEGAVSRTMMELSSSNTKISIRRPQIDTDNRFLLRYMHNLILRRDKVEEATRAHAELAVPLGALGKPLGFDTYIDSSAQAEEKFPLALIVCGRYVSENFPQVLRFLSVADGLANLRNDLRSDLVTLKLIAGRM